MVMALSRATSILLLPYKIHFNINFNINMWHRSVRNEHKHSVGYFSWTQTLPH